VHPRTKARLEDLQHKPLSKRIVFLKPFGFFDYIKLQQKSLCVVSDSGTISEEASLLDFSAVTVRSAHERPEFVDGGAVVLSAATPASVLDAVKIATKLRKDGETVFGSILDYEARSVSSKILKIVVGYTDFVNEHVWKKAAKKGSPS
jgi:UDP-N-acetylglucosamine 2-epimerase (non-hydrolysing)